MGLDMYFKRRDYVYVKRNTDGKRIVDIDNIPKHDYNDCEFDEFGASNGVEITQTIGYMRKANAIHGWIVRNVQDGKDKCQESEINENHIEQLLGICEDIANQLVGVECTLSDEMKKALGKDGSKVKESFIITKNFLKNPDKSGLKYWCYDFNLPDKVRDLCVRSLPVTEGFFFGCTEYGGNYFCDIFNAIRILKRIKKVIRDGKKDKTFPKIFYQASW